MVDEQVICAKTKKALETSVVTRSPALRGCVAVKCMDYSVSLGELFYSLSTCIVGTRIHRNPTTR